MFFFSPVFPFLLFTPPRLLTSLPPYLLTSSPPLLFIPPNLLTSSPPHPSPLTPPPSPASVRRLRPHTSLGFTYLRKGTSWLAFYRFPPKPNVPAWLKVSTLRVRLLFFLGLAEKRLSERYVYVYIRICVCVCHSLVWLGLLGLSFFFLELTIPRIFDFLLCFLLYCLFFLFFGTWIF